MVQMILFLDLDIENKKDYFHSVPTCVFVCVYFFIYGLFHNI